MTLEEFQNAFSIKVPGKQFESDPFLPKEKNERFLNARFSTLQALQKDVRCSDGKVFAGKKGVKM